MFRKMALLMFGVVMLLTSMTGCASDRPRDTAATSDAYRAGATHAPCH